MPCCPGDDLVLLAALIAISISRDVDTDTLNLLGSFYSSLGQNLSTIAAKRQQCDDSSKDGTKK
ncbi:MAG: hypothetical protein ACFWUD_04955 [Thermocaproicibacter melissae]|jgi:hypothetical protein|uniref:hypothetical protein n=1 Tax=Thermocaproicibacter melissae TaxID=2966552 RepID=UPI003A0FD4B3